MANLNLAIKVAIQGAKSLGDLSGDLDKASKSAGTTSTKAIALGSAIGSFAGGAALSIAKAGLDVAIESVGKAIDLSSNKAESASKVNVIYGKSASSIMAASEDAASTVAMSSGAYLESAGMLGNLTSSMGISQKQSADMSTTMIQLAADMGSFNNADPTDVLNAMGSALTGESEPLKKYGVLLNQASIEAKAVELGLYNGEGALKSSAKAQATYALILDQTKSAQGDLARTSDGLANQQRIASAKQEEAWTKLGDALMPIAETIMPIVQDAITTVISVIAEIAGAIGKWMKENKPLIDTLLGIAHAIGGTVIGVLKIAWDWISKLIGIVAGLLGKLGDLLGWALDKGGSIFNALIGAVKTVMDWFGKLWDTIRSTADKVMSALGKLFAPLGDSISKAIDVVKGAWNAFARFWNSIGINIPEIRIPNPLGGDIVVGGGRFSLPSLPVLDSGGIVTGPTLALLAANNRPEAIVPLDRAGAAGGITVNVYAGVGDPVAIGREVVRTIQAYQRSNGPVFAAA